MRLTAVRRTACGILLLHGETDAFLSSGVVQLEGAADGVLASDGWMSEVVRLTASRQDLEHKPCLLLLRRVR